MSRSLRSLAKRGVEKLAVVSGVAGGARRLRADRAAVLAYHNVVPSGGEPGGDRSLHLPVEEFAHQLDALVETHEVVPLSQLFGDASPRVGQGRPRAVITFDDGYRGSLTAGLRELVRRELPATYFVSPGLLGRDGFWWDELADPDHGAPRPGFRRRALAKDRGRSDDIYDRATRVGVEPAPQPQHASVADEDLLARAVEAPGIRLGSHSWSHASLDRLADEELADELRRPLSWLERRFGDRTVRWLSFPYGRTAPPVESEARAAGYRGALRISGALASANTELLSVPRINIPAGISRDAFLLRTAGL